MSAVAALTDPRGFRGLYQTHHGFVWHSLHRFGLQGAALEDALQDVFVVAYRRREDFSGSPKAWLYAIARRVASNHRRTAKRQAARVDAFAHSMGAPRVPAPEAILALDRHLDQLTDEDRELFYLSEFEGMTGPEIAALVGRNLNTVYTRIRKLRALVRDEAVAERARSQRPRASARGWAALLPCLEPSVGAATGTAAAWGVGVLVGVVGIGAVVVGRSGADEPPEPSVAPAHLEEPSEPRQPLPPRAATVPSSVSEGDPEPPTGRTAAREVQTRRRSFAVEKPSPPSTLAEENALLNRAREALQRGDASSAMRRVNEHATRFPEGVLRDLRSVVRVEALCRLGKAPQARAEASILLRRRPSMTARRRLEKSCAGSARKLEEPDMTGT